MEINYMVWIYSFGGFLLSCMVIKAFEIFAKRYMLNKKDKEDVKAFKKIFSGSYLLIFLGWLVFVIFAFGMNPIIHGDNQEVIGSDILFQEAIEQEHVDMNKVKKIGEIKIKEREDQIHDELNQTDKVSSDDYEKFLNANKR